MACVGSVQEIFAAPFSAQQSALAAPSSAVTLQDSIECATSLQVESINGAINVAGIVSEVRAVCANGEVWISLADTAEAWPDDRQCWVLIDAQEDIVGVDSDGTPMNSVEFRNSLARENPPIPYPPGLAFCMNHFGFKSEADDDKRARVMLGPIGSKMPTKFQRMPTHGPDLFTHRLADVYVAPEPESTPSTRAGADE